MCLNIRRIRDAQLNSAVVRSAADLVHALWDKANHVGAPEATTQRLNEAARLLHEAARYLRQEESQT